MKKQIIASAIALSVLSNMSTVHATGIPVFDGGNLAQNIQQLVQMMEQIKQLKQQLTQAKQMYNSLNGIRNMGDLFNNPTLKEYLPANWQNVYDKVKRGEYSGIGGVASAIEDAEKLTGTTRDSQQRIYDRERAKSFADKAMGQQAFEAAQKRLEQIEQLMGRINSASDQKAILDLQARIQSEQAAIQNEQTRMQLMAQLAEAEEKLIRQQKKELNNRIMNPNNTGMPTL